MCIQRLGDIPGYMWEILQRIPWRYTYTLLQRKIRLPRGIVYLKYKFDDQ